LSHSAAGAPSISETHPPDVDRAFRLLIGAIGAIVLIGIVILIVIVLTYRTPPGRNLAPATHSPAAQTATPSAP
jgi:hypothetical protein